VQIICKDGTSIECTEFEAIDSGVLFFQEPVSSVEDSEEDDEEAESASRADGFVPVTELHLVLPDEMVQQPPPGRVGTAQQPPGAPTGQGSMAQQQQLQQFPGPGQPNR